MRKEEFLAIADSYKSRDLVEFKCPCCGEDSTRIKKNILRSLKSVDFVCCRQACSEGMLNPRVHINCTGCGKDIQRLQSQIGENNFCGSSCAATYNNKFRVRTEESRRKTSESLTEYYESIGISKKTPVDKSSKKILKDCEVCSTPFLTSKSHAKYCSKGCSNKKHSLTPLELQGVGSGNGRQYCRVSFHDCKNCGAKILHASAKSTIRRKTCSDSCQREHMSRIQSERLSKTENRTNIGRHKKSYLEQSFEDWLATNKVEFESEIHFRNTELNKSYYVDFLFRDRNLVIELDGSQHRYTVEKDKIRDEFLSRVHGLNIVRITHKEYRTQERLSEICNLLNLETAA